MDRQLEERVCRVEGQVFAQRIALRTLARTHPEPVQLLAAWREALVEAATAQSVTATAPHGRDDLAEQIRICSEEFTAELVELAGPAPGVLPT